jgi:AraC-like DNA-binding protein/uncharacterized cupin superfamily protein
MRGMSRLSCKCWHIGKVGPSRNWSMAAHRHEHFCEFIVILAGQIETRLENAVLSGNPGDVLLYPRMQTHAERAVGSQPLELLFIGWDEAGLDVSTLPMIQHDRQGRIQTLARWIAEIGSPRGTHDHALLNHLLRSIIYAYSAGCAEPDGEMVGRVKRHVSENLSKRLTLDGLADVACLSRYHFVRRFRRLTGVSPMRFVRQARVDAARTLLLSSDLPMRAVAQRVGFADHCQLSRVFKRETGRAPSILRRG